MKTFTTSRTRVLFALVASLGVSVASSAAEHNPMTGMGAAASSAARSLKFKTSEAVPATLTLSSGSAAISDGYKPQFRFAGAASYATCAINLPKSGQKVQPGETAIVTLKCTTPWEVNDNGLSFEAFDNGHKIAEGTLRP